MRSPSVLFVGQNPGNWRNDKGPVHRRVENWADILEIKNFGFINVSPVPGEFKRSLIDYGTLYMVSIHHDKIIALGVEASRALVHIGTNHYSLPHPSRLNRQLNDKEKLNEKLNRCRLWIHTLEW